MSVPQTSKEIVLGALEFTGPRRAPVNYWTTRGKVSDFSGARPVYAHDPNRRIEGDLEVWRDLFGNTWGRLTSDKLSKGEVVEGAIRDWRQLDSLTLPDLVDDADWSAVPDRLAAAGNKFLVFGFPGLGFSLMRKMRKMENFLMDLVAEPENVDRLHRRVMAMFLKLVDKAGDLGFDGMMFFEDWGTQDRLLISPAMWRDLFKPHFRIFCDACHARGMKVIMHSCGYLGEILPDLVQTGIDALQFDQQQNYGLDFLDAHIGGKVALYSPVDIQHTLVTGNRDKIRRECFELVRMIGGRGGGFIAKSYGNRHSLEAIQCDLADNDYAFQCFMDASREVYGDAIDWDSLKEDS